MASVGHQPAETGTRRRLALSRLVYRTYGRRSRGYETAHSRQWVLTTVLLGDIAAVAVAVTASWLLHPSVDARDLLLGSTGVALAWPAILALRGGYLPSLLMTRDAGRQVRHSGVLLLALAAVAAAVAGQPVSVVTVAVVVPVLLAASLAGRHLVIRRLRTLRRAGIDVRRVVAVGRGESISELVDQLSLVTDHPIVVVGACSEGGELAEDIPVVGEVAAADVERGDHGSRGVATVLRAVAETDADAVCVVGGSVFSGDRLRALSWAVRDARVELYTAPGIVDVSSRRIDLERAGVVTLMRIGTVATRGPRRLAKAMLDRVAAAILLAALILPMTVIAILVRTTSPGPALFEQVRIGRGGRPFTMWKFRTMVVDAEAMRDELLPANEHDGVLFKLRNDPRVTWFGRLLRRTSLDELPQLVNVLCGEMSLVGPRPPLPEEVARYDAAERRRLLVRPGMTGLWQVSGRSTLNWDETVRLDLRYVDNWTLGADFRLLWRTVSAVVRGTGAY